MPRTFGEIAGYPPGTLFADRKALSEAGVHRPLQAGIAGSGVEGAESIVVSGGYEDDRDFGDLIIYTGHGGNDPNSRRQIADQKFERGNLALARNATLGLPVRVIRGARGESEHAPKSGYRYDGLCRVTDYWKEMGRSGFVVYRYRLEPLPDLEESQSLERPPFDTADAGQQLDLPEPTDRQPPRVPQTTLRVVRDTVLGKQIKLLYDYRCQVCGTRIEGPAGPYAEAAHIRPLGSPHNGPDSLDNLLCLCPNHHVLFDLRALSIADDLGLLGAEGHLQVHSRHTVNMNHLAYHRGLMPQMV